MVWIYVSAFGDSVLLCFCIQTSYLPQLSRKKASLNGNATQLFVVFAEVFCLFCFVSIAQCSLSIQKTICGYL